MLYWRLRGWLRLLWFRGCGLLRLRLLRLRGCGLPWLRPSCSRTPSRRFPHPVQNLASGLTA